MRIKGLKKGTRMGEGGGKGWEGGGGANRGLPLLSLDYLQIKTISSQKGL